MKHKFEIGTPVIVFKHKMWIDGGVGVIVERDALEPVYMVRDVTVMDRTTWVREDFLKSISFDKPKSFFQKLKGLIRR